MNIPYFQALKQLLKSSGLRTAGTYIFANFFAKGASFILLFVYSNPKYLSLEDNGLLNLFGNAAFFLMPFLSIGILQSTSVDFFKLNKNDFKNFFTTGFIIPIIVMLCSIAGLLLFSQKLKALYGFPLIFCYLIPILTFLTFCGEQYIGLIRNNNEPGIFLKTTIVRVVVEIGLSVILVLVFAWGWMGRVTGIVTANTILGVIAFFYFKQKGYLFGQLKKQYIRSEILFALPVILMQLSVFCLFSSDKFFLSYFYKNKDVGIYGYACVFASVIMLFSSATISYFRPLIYQQLSGLNANGPLIKKYFFYYTLVNLLALLGIIVFTPLMYKLFINSLYNPGLSYMYLIAIGYFFSNTTSFFQAFILYHKQKKVIMLLAILSIAISLVCNYFFIKNMGALGGALSVCISYFSIFVLTLIISKKNFSFIFIRQPKVANR